MAKMKRMTAALFLALFMCFSFSSIFTVSADELSSDDWEQISLDLQQGDQRSGEDFNFIKNNTAGSDDGEWILYLGIGFVVLGLCGITFAVFSSKRQRALARKRRAEYIKRLNSQQRPTAQRRPAPDAAPVRRNVAKNPQQRRPVQNQQPGRPTPSQGSRGYSQQRPQSSHGGYIGGSGRYVDNGARYQPVPEGSDQNVYSNSQGNYNNPNYRNGDYDDGYRDSGRTVREPLNEETRVYNRRPVQQGYANDEYEDISSFSSDRNIYSSSKKNNKYINDYIDY